MKLVSGLEAIQSGKPFRYHYPGGTSPWFDKETPLMEFNRDMEASVFLDCLWEIRQEPREFWIFNKAVDDYIECQSVIQTVYPNEDGWIKVREVME